MTDFWRPWACAIGWHVLTFRSDEYGDYVGCTNCDFADTQAVRTLLTADTGNNDA